MRVVVFTITCNRIDTTKQWIKQLKSKAGMDFEHIVIDNGSTDGTVEWLQRNGFPVLSLNKNYGILAAMKIAIKHILNNYAGVEYIVKFDDDCQVHTTNILKTIIDWYCQGCKSFVVAPLDSAILAKQMPRVFHEGEERGLSVRYTRHVGGIFKVMSKLAAEILLKAPPSEVNGDLKRGDYWKKKGIDTVYLTDLKITHKGIGKQTKKYNLG